MVIMGFTMRLIIIYMILTALTVIAFVRGKKLIGTIIITVMLISVIVLIYMWMSTPM